MASKDNGLRILEAIYSDFIGGSEMLGLRLGQEFTARGHTCDILATYRGDGGLRPLLDESGLAWYSTAYTGRSLLKRVLTPIRLYLLFRRGRYDVIHAHHMSVYITCYWPARLARVKRIVITEHAHQQFIGRKKRMWRARRYGPRADAVTVIHTELERFFHEDLGIDDKLIQLIPNGVDTQKFAAGETSTEIRQLIQDRGWSVVLGCVGRMHPDKDIPNLIHTFAIVARKAGAGVGLVIVGDGEERQQVEELITHYGLEEQTLLAGSQTNVEMWIRAFDLFVQPSRREGVPLAILESLSCGVPVVATAVGGVPDVIDDSVGRLTPPSDPARLASAILDVTESDDELHSLAKNARKLVLDKYSIEKMVDRYLECLADDKK
jgi:glycosyltransferase involved in cell wall biosynthesis